MGKWVKIEDGLPKKPGRYKVISYINKEDVVCKYIWNGSHFETTRGTLTQSVLEWYDEEADGNE